MSEEKAEGISVKQSFLSMFCTVEPNKKYRPAKVAAFYHVIGEHLLKFPIQIKKFNIDARFSFGVCINSGYGKEAIKNVVIESGKKTGKKVETFTSLHEEQLIGKRWFDSDINQTMELRGYFYSHFLVKDDGLPFMNSAKYELARNYTLTALDVYKKNLITKKLVGEETGLAYYGRCSFLFFVQPSEKIKEENISSGLFRKAPILRIDLTKEEVYEIIDRRCTENYNPEPEIWLEFLRNISNIRNLTYKNLKKEHYKRINRVVKEYYSENSLLKSLNIIHQNNLIKFSYINSLLSHYNSYNPYNPDSDIELEVSDKDVSNAIRDYKIIYSAIYDFVEKNTLKENRHHIEEVILQILKQEDCFSEETSKFSSSEMIELVSKKLAEKKPTVVKHFYKLKTEERINTKQVGQTDSKVWLVK